MWERAPCSQPSAERFLHQDSLPVDYYTAAPAKHHRMKTAASFSSAARRAAENSSVIVALLLRCQPAPLSLNDKHPVLFWAICRTAGVSRAPTCTGDSSARFTQIIHLEISGVCCQRVFKGENGSTLNKLNRKHTGKLISNCGLLCVTELILFYVSIFKHSYLT